ncbi:NAD(P)-dependent oxidoreductase [Trujillonella endophytica]|uniref:3-hydroxyisobutyrate dehydrogenase n=1 Tax=Trujillonella endophytica TaxID=673521 RepID=A0A1H8W7B5_9ACTN|nr:NAD(P)-dependent oxidoreductase [Trujillella endophytica]SEP23556.1 3-hydroxyisobutyrate dehydrogenase [Trujillella endophytica]
MSGTTPTPPTTDRVGFIGLGSQGGPMARRIVEDGVATVLWARRQETLDAYADTAAEYASSPADLAARVDIACVCVLNDEGVEEVVAGPEGLLSAMAPGGVIAIHSTVHPETCQRLAEQAAAKGITLIDAPVSGGGPGAEAKRLLVMVGGDAETLERVRPVFETYANPIVHLGPVGAGQRAKLINNLMLTANLGVLESAYALARSLSVDPEQLSTVLSHGSGNSFAVNVLRGPDFVLGPMGAMAGPLLQKDARLVVDLATAAGAEPGTVLTAADAALSSMGCQR